MQQTIQIARIWGIPIGFNRSWFIIFAFLTWSLATGFMPEAFPEMGAAQYWVIATVTSLLFFGSVLFHELAHALFALRHNIGVKRITLFIFGGVAEMEAEPKSAWAEFVIAVAGPASSFLAAGFFYLITLISGLPMWITAPAGYLMSINLILAIFNMIPGFPLDGGRMLRAGLWAFTDYSRATRIASFSGQLFAYLFIGIGVYMAFTGNVVNGLWLVFIGWFLNNAASAHGQQARALDSLAGVTVSDIMRPRWEEVEGNLPISKLYKDHVLRGSPPYIFVRLTGYGYDEEVHRLPHGMLTLTDIMTLKPASWQLTPVQTIMTAWHNLVTTDADTPLSDALMKMESKNLKQMPVLRNGSLVGVLTRENALRFISMQAKMGRA